MKKLLLALLALVLVLSLIPAVAIPEVEAIENLSLTWNQGTYYDGKINPNLVSRKYAVIDCAKGDVITFTYPSDNWAIYVYYQNENGSYSYKTSKRGSNETFVIEETNGWVPTQLQLTVFHRSGNNVTITDELWETFDVTITKTGSQSIDTNTFTFATQNVGLWNDGVNQGVAADKVETRAAAWQQKMTNHKVDILVAQEWLPYLDSDKTVDANSKVFGSMYPYRYGTNTSTYDGKAIVSKAPLSNISYETMVSNVGRRYLKAYTTIGGKQVCIINAHLSFEDDINTNRKEEIVQLLNMAQTEKYVIIAGDFNTFTADEFRIFEEAGYSLANAGAFGEFNTWPNLGRNPTANVNRVIDNIIVSPGIKINSVVAEDTMLSDHALLVAELQLLEENEFTDQRLMCEHCGKFVTWIPVTETNGSQSTAIRDSGHYYLPNDLTKVNSQFWIGVVNEATPDVVLDLRGHAVVSTARAFYVRKGSKLTIVDTVGCGTITAGSGSTGGLAYVENSASFTLYDGVLTGSNTSTAKKGGVLYLETSASFVMEGGELHGGYGADGGVICGGNKNTIKINGGTIYGSQVTGAGGAIWMSGGTLEMTGGTIYGGTSQGSGGGALYVSGSTVRLTGGTITGGSGPYGGNVHVTSNSSTDGLELGACTITGGTASGAGKDIYLSGTGKLKVLKSFAGTSYIAVNTAHLTDTTPGATLDTGLDSAEGYFPGKLILESLSAKPQLCGAEGESGLYIASAALADEKGNLTWYAHNASAVANYGDAAYLVPAAGALTLTGGDYTVDLAGKILAITGTGTVTCFDSSNDTYTTYGTATISGPALVNTGYQTVAGRNCVTLVKDGVYSFHRLDMGITQVSIRPSAAGMYYSGTWYADATLKAQIRSYGVAVSVVKMPDSAFMELGSGAAWTAFAGSTLENGTPMTGCIVSGILKTGAANDERARMKIYAATYVVLEGGAVLLGEKTADYSLYDVMKLMDETAYAANAEALEKFYKTWEYPMKNWDFTNIGK